MVDNKVNFYEEIKIIKSFSGDVKDLRKFLASVFIARSNLELPDEPEYEVQGQAEKRFIQAISAKLDAETFRKISLSNPRNMAEFKKSLYEIFHIIKDKAKVFCKLTSIEQWKNESIVDYIDRIESMKQNYEIACEYSDDSPIEKDLLMSQLDKQIQKSCINGMSSNIRIYCKSRNFNSFKELKDFTGNEN